MNGQKGTEENQSKHSNNLAVKPKFLTGKGARAMSGVMEMVHTLQERGCVDTHI